MPCINDRNRMDIKVLQRKSTKKIIIAEDNEEGVISKSNASIVNPRVLDSLDPRPFNMSSEGIVGFVKRPALYGVLDNLKVIGVSGCFRLSYLQKQNLPIDDLEVKMITIGEAEVRWLLCYHLNL
jgi:hypothetical protein